MVTSLAFAEVLKAWLNSEDWVETFTAEIPVDLSPPPDAEYFTSALRCIVLPREDEYSRISRDPGLAGEYQIDAFLAAHVDHMSAVRIYNQAHAIVKKLLKTPGALTDGFTQGVRRALWLPNHLQDKRIFGTVITVELRTSVDED